MSLKTLLLVSLMTILWGSALSQPHEHGPWCGNHIFDPTKPKGLSDWASLQLKKTEKKKSMVLKGAVTATESEPNDSYSAGNFVDLSAGSATVTGIRDLPISFPIPASITSSENNDSINTATPLNLIQAETNGVITNVVAIGDGQFGDSTGDFDFYAFNASVGDLMLFDITSDGFLDPIVGIYNSSGNLIRLEDDQRQGKPDPFLRWTPELNGTYYLCVAGLRLPPEMEQIPLTDSFPTNPFQPGTGRGRGFIGFYNLTAFRLTPLVVANEPNGTLAQSIPIIQNPGATAEFFIFGRIDNTIFSGDFDFFNFNAAAGQTFEFEAITPDPSGSVGLDPVLAIYDGFGNGLAVRGDTNKEGGDLDTSLVFTAPSAGTYGLLIGAQMIDDPFAETGLPSPFDGIGSGIGSVGFYTIIVSTNNTDPDFVTFDLEQGDIFSARAIADVTGFGAVRPNQNSLAYTFQNVNAFSAPGSPFPVGDLSLSFVAPETGRYALEIFTIGSLRGDTPWQIDMMISEPGFTEEVEGSRQIVFIDFDGATVDARELTGTNPAATLSPLSTFLPIWGISANQESQLIDQILEIMEENLITDIGANGANGNFDVSGTNGEFGLTLLNSRDHPDPWGQPNVSRLVVGGTIAELGVGTIGIAQSIDPGNYDREETGVVLLDLMSGTPDKPDSLLQFNTVNGATIIDVVATAIGNISSHEIGHYIGNWHTIKENDQLNIMDQGGIISNSIGVGADMNFGSLDDINVEFVEDDYTPSEVYFIGRENTLQVMSFGLSTGIAPAPVFLNDMWFVQ